MDRAPAVEVESYERRYRDLAGELAAVGYIASGSLARRYNRCGKPRCACHADPARLHGPYWLFTAKVNGKTVNRRLSEDEAALYEQWIANDRKARSLLAEMRALADKLRPLILEQHPDQAPRSPEPKRRRSSPQPRAASSRGGS